MAIDGVLEEISILRSTNREYRPKILELDSLLQLKESGRDFKKSLTDYILNAWSVNISPRYMESKEILDKFDGVGKKIKSNYEEPGLAD